MFLMSHYCRRYSAQKKASEKIIDTYKKLHDIAECFRETFTKAFSKPENKRNPKKLIHDFVEEFRSQTDIVCSKLKEAFRDLGYEIDGVCIKSYNSKLETLHVIGRSDKSHTRESTDLSEPVSEHVFFKLLLEINTAYQDYLNNPEVLRIRRNMRDTRPVYLAIGNFDSPYLPKVFSSILVNYELQIDSTENHGKLYEDGIRQAIAKRAGNQCKSCIGVPINDRSAPKNFTYTSCNGYICLESRNPKALDHLEPKHMHLIAIVADILYVMITFYERARELSEVQVQV